MSEMKDLREKEDKELRKILGETRVELSRILGERASGSKKDSSSSRKKRREVARILTVLKEKEILTHSTIRQAHGGPSTVSSGRSNRELSRTTLLRVNPEFTEGLKQVADNKESKMDGPFDVAQGRPEWNRMGGRRTT